MSDRNADPYAHENAILRGDTPEDRERARRQRLRTLGDIMLALLAFVGFFAAWLGLMVILPEDLARLATPIMFVVWVLLGGLRTCN